MFGPSAASPNRRNVVICQCGSDAADKAAAKLFGSSGANVVMLGLDEHDRLMAYALGLPHLCTLTFAMVADSSGTDISSLKSVQGPSFERCSRIAAELSNESRRVYHDIQLLNPHSRRLMTGFERAVKELRNAALAEDPESFRKIMDRCKMFAEVS
jgi:chorismate mutase/prephenate dehydrogenase